MIDGLVTKCQKTVYLNSVDDVLEIHPWGDVHWDTDECEHDRFDADIAEMKKSKNKKLFLGMGDYLDFMAWGDRKKAQTAGFHGTTMQKLHKVGMQDMRAFQRKIEFMGDDLIGLIDGNHGWVFEDGKSQAERLCEGLHCAYLGWISYIRLVINMSGCKSTIGIVACHGKGGGKLAGTSINQVEDLLRIFPDADIYIEGHNHQRGGIPIQRLFAQADRKSGGFDIKSRTQWLCRSGSYMRAYQIGSGGFVSGKLMSPSSLGKITIRVRLNRLKGQEDGKLHNNLTIKVEA